VPFAFMTAPLLCCDHARLSRTNAAVGLEPTTSPPIHWDCSGPSNVESRVLYPLSYAAI
jgi:hypothetical protein